MSKLEERYNALASESPGAKKFLWKTGTKDGTDKQLNLTSRIVDLIFEQAVIEKASDIHVEPHNNNLKIRYRIDGLLYDVLHLDKESHVSNIMARIKLAAGMQTDAVAQRKSQDGRFTIQFGANNYDFRISTFPTVNGEKIAIRILDRSDGIYQLDKLGLEPYDLNKLEKILTVKSGLVLVCGPTGSGKTTTLYALISQLNRPENNIVTLEDPVEYQIEGMNQCDIKSKSDFSFADGLKSILRQDPDIILVGEIRDKETSDVALQAAITGHMVFSSVHATSAIGTILRLTNMGLDHFLVSFALNGAIAQRLVRQICHHCKEEYHINDEQVQKLISKYGLDANLLKPEQPVKAEAGISYVDDQGQSIDSGLTFYKGRGCDNCRGTGYKNRIALFEVVIFEQQLREAILQKVTAAELQKIAIDNGGRTLAMDAIAKVKKGWTTLDEVYPVLIER